VNDGSIDSQVATVSINVTPLADVAVFKTGPTTGRVGTNMLFTITVTNLGPSMATNVVLIDQLPPSYTFVSAVPTPASVANHVVTWSAFDVATHGSSNFSVTVMPTLDGVYTNVASATSTTVDPDPSNNSSSSTQSQVRTVIDANLGILQGTNWLNPQTGLFEQRVTVTNTSSTTLAAFCLLVGDIRSIDGTPRTNVFLANATGTNMDTRPFVQYNAPLDPGGRVTLILEFRVGDRRPFTNSLEAIAVLPAVANTNSGIGVVLGTAFMDLRFGEPRCVLEWTSTPGRSYTVIYCDTGLSGPWLVATPVVTAAANRVQWYDDGPPKTVTKPLSVNSRYYRVIEMIPNP
jgi:uncharacterized repeat protein (TIGR01451 family)